ncbi:MAG: hypothetical protein WDA17_04895 [Sphaerochaetaceae bacterium]
MAKVHYFPRYKREEDFITNTVLHLFTQIYMHSPYRLNTILNEIIETKIPLGFSIVQQEKGKESFHS